MYPLEITRDILLTSLKTLKVTLHNIVYILFITYLTTLKVTLHYIVYILLTFRQQH